MGRYFVLGIVFFLVIGTLGWATIFLGNIDFSPRDEISVDFHEARGLRPGDAVLVSGARAGRVNAVVLKEDGDPAFPIRVYLSLDRKVTLRQGFEIRIEASTLLGGRIVEIKPGRGEPVELERIDGIPVVLGTVGSDPIEGLGVILEENRKDVREIVAGIREIVRGIEQGEGTLGLLLRNPEVHERLLSLLENAEGLVKDIRSGEGAVAKLLFDPETGRHVSNIITRADEVVTNVAEGRGTVGRLLMKDELADRIVALTDELQEALEAINDPKAGVIGLALHDRATRDRIAGTIENLDAIVAYVRSGEGDLGGFLMKDRITTDVVKPLGETLADIAKIVRELEEGRGVAGMLLRDDEMAALARNALRAFARSIEDAREAAPISTLVTALSAVF
ncbi:MAG: MCE family protein [Planctomycetes bacterium]|nr:MCE family protein [Planctomycetota bacterium]